MSLPGRGSPSGYAQGAPACPLQPSNCRGLSLSQVCVAPRTAACARHRGRKRPGRRATRSACRRKEKPMKDGGTGLRRLSAAGLRMRKVQQRRQQGMRCITIEIRESEIAALVARGLLPKEQAEMFVAPRSQRKDRSYAELQQGWRRRRRPACASPVRSVFCSRSHLLRRTRAILTRKKPLRGNDNKILHFNTSAPSPFELPRHLPPPIPQFTTA
jgi:hypothetical protein